MQRTYLALTGLALAGVGLAAGAAAPLVRAAGLFESRPLDASRFAVLAKPVGDTDWNLLVLEQVQKQMQLQLHVRQHFVPIHVDELELMQLQ